MELVDPGPKWENAGAGNGTRRVRRFDLAPSGDAVIRTAAPVTLLSLTLLGLGCESARSGRHFVEFEWAEEVYVRAGVVDDTLLSLPRQVLRWSDQIVVRDAAPPFIRVFDDGGRLVRAFGNEGQGPGELTQPLSAAVRNVDRLLVLEVGGRILEFDRLGHSRGFYKLGRESISMDLDVRGDTLFLASYLPPSTTVVPLASPEDAHTVAFPWADTLHDGTRLHRLIRATQWGWISAAKMGPGFFFHSGDSVEFLPYVDPTTMMNRYQPVDEQRLAAHSLMLSNDSVLFLYGGRIVYPRGDRPQMLDVYDERGRYAYSARLPRPIVDLIRFEDGFMALGEEPVPTLWKWTPIVQ